jgi:hypothetical protein
MANLLTYPTASFSVDKQGQLNPDFFNFFSMNNQEFQRYFSNDGHLVPTRTDDELKKLSTSQYTARYAYNGTTKNAMVNIDGTYENLTVFLLNEDFSELSSRTHKKNRMQFFADTNKNLFVNIDGELFQISLTPV